MGKLFTTEELEQVLQDRKQTRDKKSFVRLSVLVMIDSGYTYEDISVAHGVNPTTISTWKSEYTSGGLKAVLNDHYKPFTGYLTEEQLSAVDSYVDSVPCRTSRQVGDWIYEQFDQDYTDAGVTAILHRLGFTYKRICLVGHKADQAKQEAFIRSFEDLMGGLSQVDKVFFSDGVHPSHNMHAHCQWIRKGERRELPANTGRKRVNLVGVVNAEDVTEVEVLECDRVNTDSTIELLEKVKTVNPKGTKFVICDNARYYRSKKMVSWQKENPDVVLVFLPPYSPNLNVIERLWGHMKERVCTQFYEEFKDFRAAILDYFAHIGNFKEEFETLLALNFSVLQKPTKM